MTDKIAIVEDDVILREELCCFFIDQGYEVYEANNYMSLLDILKTNNLFLIVLDLNLPGKNGYEIATLLKTDMPNIGIIMLTAKTSLADKVRGYEMGADIYLPKPTDPLELLAAAKSLSVRIKNSSLNHKPFQLNLSTSQISSNFKSLELNPIEVTVIRSLILSPHQSVDIAELSIIFEEKFTNRSNSRRALENSISRLRHKLMSNFSDQINPIKSVRNYGYQLTWQIEMIS